MRRVEREGGRLRRLAIGLLLAGALAAAIAGCGSSSSSSSSSGSASSASTSSAASGATALPLKGSQYVSASGGCGTVPNAPVTGGSSVVNTLPADVRPAYAGYPAPVQASPWLTFKPKHPKPWTVDYIISNLNNSYQNEENGELHADMAKYKSAGYIKSFSTIVTGLNPTAEIQATQAALTKGVDLIIASPLSPTAYASVAATALKDGVPIVAPLTTIPGTAAVTIQTNPYLVGGASMAGVASEIGAKGDVLFVHGIPGVPVDTEEFAGAKAALTRCPHVKVAGQVTGNFSAATAKTATLEFLNTHPSTINAAMSGGTQGPGIIEAFQQAGRPVASLAEGGAQVGSVAYWNDNKATYKADQSGQGATVLADATVSIAMRILAGRGPKTDQITVDPPMITSANLSQWVTPGATLQTPGTAEGPPGNFAPDSYLDKFFKTPGAPLMGLNK